jgi:hypothetical protein
MQLNRFDTITQALSGPRSRRQALSGLAVAAAALAGGGVIGAGVTEAKKGGNGKGKKKGKEKVTLCQHGHTIRVARPAVQKHLDNGATEGACA